jgi:hypothetical protein
MVGIKGAVSPVAARRLLAIADHQARRSSEPKRPTCGELVDAGGCPTRWTSRER